MSMGCSSVCEKNKDGSSGGKTQEILFYTLDKTFPFDRKYLLSNLWRKSSEKNRKNWHKNSPKILKKTAPKCPFL